VIVLDENLLGLRLDQAIARWYPGRVCYVANLRPNTIIKDETITQLLQQAKGAAFVTTNAVDFWQRILCSLGPIMTPLHSTCTSGTVGNASGW
jgi:hypothetical protein